MPDSEKEGYRRADMNQYFFHKAEIAEMFDVSAMTIESVKYNDVLYYKVEKENTYPTDTTDLIIDQTILLRMDYGYLYMFSFTGYDNHPYYKDFESLMESIEYPAIVDITDEVVPKSKATDSSIFYDIIVSFMITLLTYTLPLCFYRFVIRRTPVNSKKAKIVCMIYGLITFSVTSILIFRAGNNILVHSVMILFWALVNYQFLIYKDQTTKFTS